MVKFQHFFDRLEELGKQYNHPDVCSHVTIKKGPTSTIISYHGYRQALINNPKVTEDEKTAKIIAERIFINDYASTFFPSPISVLWNMAIDNSSFTVFFDKKNSSFNSEIISNACESFGMTHERKKESTNKNSVYFYGGIESYSKTINTTEEVFVFVMDILAPLLFLINE